MSADPVDQHAGAPGPAWPAAVVLAAGAGSRFGLPKALVRWRGELLVQRAVRVAAEAGCDPVLAVVGLGAARVIAATGWTDEQAREVPDWKLGQSRSLLVALAWAREVDAPAVVVMLADQPLIGPLVVRELVARWLTGAGPALVATYEGRRGNPVLLDSTIWDSVGAEASGDEGARGWLQAHADLVVPVECGHLGRDDDIDTGDDLARLLP